MSDWSWLNIALAFWGTIGWFLFWWVALRRNRTKDNEWGYVVLLKPEDDKTQLRTVWCSRRMAEKIAGDADVVHS